MARKEKYTEDVKIKSFVDMVAPSVIKFFPDYFICGNTYRCIWALREYPPTTDELAILKHIGEKDGTTLKIYTRHVSPAEEKKIISNAANKNRMKQSSTNDFQEIIVAEGNLQNVSDLVTSIQKNREPLIHTAVYIELISYDHAKLKELIKMGRLPAAHFPCPKKFSFSLWSSTIFCSMMEQSTKEAFL